MVQINHIQYPKTLKKKSDNELRYIINDCKLTLVTNPHGEKAGYYADEINYCCNELHKRNNN